MGIPGFFRWLTAKYPHTIETAKLAKNAKAWRADFLYVDLNALFHVAMKNKRMRKKANVKVFLCL
jgi:5'-3' exonuclease